LYTDEEIHVPLVAVGFPPAFRDQRNGSNSGRPRECGNTRSEPHEPELDREASRPEVGSLTKRDVIIAPIELYSGLGRATAAEKNEGPCPLQKALREASVCVSSTVHCSLS
jgi:hypothetical protein